MQEIDTITETPTGCDECGLDLIHTVDCSRRVEPPAETPIAAAPSIETPEPEPQTTFLFTCNDGSQYDIPSRHPDLAIGGFMDADGEFRGTEFVMHDPQLMPVHFQQFYLAGSRTCEPKEFRDLTSAEQLAEVVDILQWHESSDEKVTAIHSVTSVPYSVEVGYKPPEPKKKQKNKKAKRALEDISNALFNAGIHYQDLKFYGNLRHGQHKKALTDIVYILEKYYS